MGAMDQDSRRPESARERRTHSGWTALHSWIFIAIVAVGLTVIGIQNRYQYLSIEGSGKAFRVDKLSGAFQEFSPMQGWIVASFEQETPARESMAQPSSASTQPLPMDKPVEEDVKGELSFKEAVVEKVPQENKVRMKELNGILSVDKPARPLTPPPAPEQPAVKEQVSPRPVKELSVEEKFQTFKEANPEFGDVEFELASDKLFPDWKQSVNPNGTWKEFLKVYGNFIQWWLDAGSPEEDGFNLWKKYLSNSRGN
jgi:hypothetical protein